MRATALSLLALLAIACSAPTCRAQSAGSGKAGAPQAQGGSENDDSLSPSTLPKARQTVKEDPAPARINALSPDEERRLQRTRARAHAASGGPAPGSPETSPAAPRKEAAGPKEAAAPNTTVAPKKAPPARAAVAARAASDRVAPRKHAAATVSYDRRARRDTADLRERRVRPSRRAFAEDRMPRGPRVGDVLPPGVALYPLPPGYGPPRAYGPAPLPFPRADDDDGPPRRVFMEPF